MVLDSFGVRSVGVGIRLCMMPYVAFYWLWRLLPLLSLTVNLGELRLRSKVLIRTGLGTMAALVGSAVAVVDLWNYTGLVLGT